MAAIINFESRKNKKIKDKTSDINADYVEEASKIFKLLIRDNSRKEASPKLERGIINIARKVGKMNMNVSQNILLEFSKEHQVSLNIIKELACFQINNSQEQLGVEILEKIASSKFCDMDTLDILVGYYMENENYEKALEKTKQAQVLVLKSQKPNKKLIRNINDSLILINDVFDQHDEILELVENEKEYNALEPATYMSIATAYNLANQPKKAIKYYEKARDLSLKVNKDEELENNQSIEFLPFGGGELLELSDLYQKYDRLDDSLECILEGLKKIEPEISPLMYSTFVKRKNELKRLMSK